MLTHRTTAAPSTELERLEEAFKRFRELVPLMPEAKRRALLAMINERLAEVEG